MATKKPRRKGVAEKRVDVDDVLPEYDFSGGVSNPYARHLARDTVLVALEPDVARIFPDAAAVNEALRALGRIAERAAAGPAPRRRGR